MDTLKLSVAMADLKILISQLEFIELRDRDEKMMEILTLRLRRDLEEMKQIVEGNTIH